MTVAVKNSMETASPSVLDRFSVASLAGVAYVYVSIAAVFYGLPALWGSLGVASKLGAAVSTALLIVLMFAAGFGIVVAGVRLLLNASKEGLRASILTGSLWVLFALVITSSIGMALESNLHYDPSMGVPLTAGLFVVLLAIMVRLVGTVGYEQKMVVFEQQGWFSSAAFKRGQGLRVRRGTILGILVLAGCGVYTILSHGTLSRSGTDSWDLMIPYANRAEITKPGDTENLPEDVRHEYLGGSGDIEPGMVFAHDGVATLNGVLTDDYVKVADPGDTPLKTGQLVKRSDFEAAEAAVKQQAKLPPLQAKPAPAEWLPYPRLTVLPHVMFTLPLLIGLGSIWFAYRIVNYPVFADFLIATEAEMNKVSWHSPRNVMKDTVVVLVTVLLLTVFLFLVDQLWAFTLTKVGVIQTPPPSKQAGPGQEVPW